LERSNNAKSSQALNGGCGNHLEMLDPISSIWLWPIGVDRVFKGVESVVDGCISNCVNGDLKVKGIGKIDDGE
jgi:hypothetical protein